MEESTPAARGSAGKNVVAVLLMVVVLGASGYYIFGRYQQQQQNQATVDAIAQKADPAAIKASRDKLQQQAKTAKKFAPLLMKKKPAAEEGAAAKDAEAKKGDAPAAADPFDAPAAAPTAAPADKPVN